MVSMKMLAAAVGTAMLFTLGAAEAQTRSNDSQKSPTKNTQKSTTKNTMDKNTGQSPGASRYAPGRSDNPPPGQGGKVPGQEMRKDKESDRKASPTRR